MALAGAAALAAAAPPSPRPSPLEDGADLILRHGIFYPATARPSPGSAPERILGSLAVRAGRIVYLGGDAGALALRRPATRVVELGGRAVTPGLIDAHSHLLGLGEALEEVDLRGSASYDEVIRRVTAAARELPAGAWVRGRGWDQNRWPGKAFPTAGPLSAAVPDHPVWLTRVDGHAALLNGRALASLGVSPTVADPAGGRYLRDAAGAPAGVVLDNAMEALR